MEIHPERIENGITRADGSVTPFNAGDAIGVVADYCRERGIPLAPSVKARLGKGAKALLASHFPPQIIVLACTAALRTGWYGSVETIAQDMMVTKQGERTSRKQYQQHLERLAVQMEIADNPVWQLVREDAARRAERTEHGTQ